MDRSVARLAAFLLVAVAVAGGGWALGLKTGETTDGGRVPTAAPVAPSDETVPLGGGIRPAVALPELRPPQRPASGGGGPTRESVSPPPAAITPPPVSPIQPAAPSRPPPPPPPPPPAGPDGGAGT